MLFKKIESEGLAQFSYIIGDKGEAVVIDPRRDCDIYIEETSKRGFRIGDILETHRNEDYLTGSLELKARTGANVWHADSQLSYRYGQPVQDDQTWKVGGLKLKAIHSPGHTLGSMSYLLHDHNGFPWIIFTGDSLFAGDVGRVDLLGVGKSEKMAGLLYDTIFDKLLPLGDELIVCPAHGSGSVCGAAIDERAWTTIGFERSHNPKLQLKDKGEFVANLPKELERPPYFLRMEKLNIEGPPLLNTLPSPSPLRPVDFSEKAREGSVVDTRSELAFGAAHIPGSLSIWMDGLPNFAGWFLPYEKPALLVNETNDSRRAVTYLIRMGYDDIAGYLSGGMLAWHKSGLQSGSINMITVQKLCHKLDQKENFLILDVRSREELITEGEITGAQHIHITQIPNHVDDIPRNRPVYIFCGSGLRSTIAASLLRRLGWENLTVVLGGIAGWNSITCPIK